MLEWCSQLMWSFFFNQRVVIIAILFWVTMTVTSYCIEPNYSFGFILYFFHINQVSYNLMWLSSINKPGCLNKEKVKEVSKYWWNYIEIMYNYFTTLVAVLLSCSPLNSRLLHELTELWFVVPVYFCMVWAVWIVFSKESIGVNIRSLSSIHVSFWKFLRICGCLILISKDLKYTWGTRWWSLVSIKSDGVVRDKMLSIRMRVSWHVF